MLTPRVVRQNSDPGPEKTIEKLRAEKKVKDAAKKSNQTVAVESKYIFVDYLKYQHLMQFMVILSSWKKRTTLL